VPQRISNVIGRLAALAFAAFLCGNALAAEPLIVHLDEAEIVRLPDRVATVVVGNPLIADVSAQAGGVLVVTGKSYGRTNLLVLDRSGAALLEQTVQVEGPRGPILHVHRGVTRETYSCTPECERRITLGDAPDFFGATLDQSGARANQAAGGTAR